MKKENKRLMINLFWIIGFIIITLIICITIFYISTNAWVLRFEMDDNTLEAIKTINWSVIENATRV